MRIVVKSLLVVAAALVAYGEALAVRTKLPFPEKMPRNIEKFNRRADAKYRKHEEAIDALLSSANLK